MLPKLATKLMTAAVVSVGLFAVSGAQSAPLKFTVCGASPGGLWSLLGAGLDAAAKAADKNSVITYATSSGGYANIVQVIRKKCELGIIQDGEALIAHAGTAPFKKPIKGFVAISVLYDWAPIMWIMTKEFSDKYGIKSVEDLAKKKPPVRIVMNRRGILPSQMTEEVLKATGVSIADIKKWGGKVEFQASRIAGELMQNRRADLYANSLFIGHRSIRKIARSVPIVMLQTGAAAIAAVAKKFGAKKTTIPAKAHPWQPNAVNTFSPRAILIVSEKMADATAYALTKAMLDHYKKIQGIHKAMKAFNPKLMASQTVLPYHPGALKAYKEAGLK